MERHCVYQCHRIETYPAYRGILEVSIMFNLHVSCWKIKVIAPIWAPKEVVLFYQGRPHGQKSLCHFRGQLS